MVIKKEVRTQDSIETTIIHRGYSVTIIVDSKHTNLVQSVNILREEPAIPNLDKVDKLTLGAATYTRVSNRDFEKHLKRATNYLLKSFGTDYVAVDKNELDRLTRLDVWGEE